MQRGVNALCLTFAVLLFCQFIERPLKAQSSLPNDVLTGMEIRELVKGKTAEVLFVKKKEEGLFFFNPNGEFQQLTNNWLEYGTWQIKDSDSLCFRIAGNRWDCRMLIRDEDGIGQFIKKKDGTYQRELTYVKFTDGNKLLEPTESSFPPLVKLNKKEIFKLFSDKTVESETVSKGRVSLTYYYPDGTLELLRNGKKYLGAWWVTDNDRMCLSLETSKEKCRIIVRQGSTFSKYIVKKNGKHQRSINYRRFESGKQF